MATLLNQQSAQLNKVLRSVIYDILIYIYIYIYIYLFLFLHLFQYRIYLRTVVLWCIEKSNFKDKYQLVLIKRRSLVHEKNKSRERVLNFNQWKTFSENYKPIRVWLLSFTTFHRLISKSKEISASFDEWAFSLGDYLSYQAILTYIKSIKIYNAARLTLIPKTPTV